MFHRKKKYVKDLLKAHNMQNCKPVPVPLTQSAKLQLFEKFEVVDATHYRRLIGKLLYLTHSRPNIIFVVSVLSRFMSQPNKFHLGTLKHVLKYISGIIEFGIHLVIGVEI